MSVKREALKSSHPVILGSQRGGSLRVRCRAWSRLRVGEPLTHGLVLSKLRNSCSRIALERSDSTRTITNIGSRVGEGTTELRVGRVVGWRVPRCLLLLLLKAALVAKWLTKSWAISATISGSSGESG
jgi:hypothetical protein